MALSIPTYYKIKSLFPFTNLTRDLYKAVNDGRNDDVRALVQLVDKSILNTPYNELGIRKLSTQVGRTFLMDAAQEGYVSITRILLKAGAAPNLKDKNGRTALSLAARNGHCRTMEVLLSEGANANLTDSYEFNALMLTFIRGMPRSSNLLIKETKNLNALDYSKQNALMHAVGHLKSENGDKWHEYNLENIRSLIKSGININWQDDCRNSALTLSINDRNDFSDVLIDEGANLNLQDKYDETALMLAAKKNNPIYKKLIAKGADLNLVNHEDKSALMMAIISGHSKIAKDLIFAKANLDLVDEKGNDALVYAKIKNNIELMALLIGAGAKLDKINMSSGHHNDMIANDGLLSQVILRPEVVSALRSAFQKAHAGVESSKAEKGTYAAPNSSLMHISLQRAPSSH